MTTPGARGALVYARAHWKGMLAYVGVVALAMVVLVGGYGLYRASIIETVNRTTTSFMDQTADHDTQAFHNALARKWEVLESFAERLRITGADSKDEVDSLLAVETQATAFKSMDLVSSDGRVYQSTGQLGELSDMPWHEVYDNSASRFVARYESPANPDSGESDVRVLYGVKLSEPLYLNGETIEGVVGFIPVATIVDTMRFESFDERGVALVVQSDGTIVTASSLYSGIDETNYLNGLAQAHFAIGTFEECAQALATGGSTFAEYYIGDNNFYAAIKPIEDTDWHLVVRVNGSVTSDVVAALMAKSLLFFIALGIAVILVALVVYRSVRTARIARESERAKTAFLSNMSHEIRTPLNGIVGILYLMRQNIDNPAKMASYLDQADVSASFLKSVISDVLDMSKIESGSVDLRVEPFDMRAVINEVIVIARAQANGRLSVESAEQLPAPFLRGDAVRLKQALMNLLGNAVKFTPDGGLVELKVVEYAGENTADLTIVVSDNGCGMGKDFLDKLWQPFEQERRVSSQSGTGLGAPLTKAIVESMGGTISVRTELGEGSEFTVRLELPVASKEQAASLVQERPEVERTLAGARVLVAEDNDVNRMIIEDILDDEEAVVTSVADGQKVVNAFLAAPPNSFDVVLLDMQMPVLDGYGAAQAIRASDRPDAAHIPILALTANAFREDRERALACGMNDVLVKPLNVTLLLEKLRECDRDA